MVSQMFGAPEISRRELAEAYRPIVGGYLVAASGYFLIFTLLHPLFLGAPVGGALGALSLASALYCWFVRRVLADAGLGRVELVALGHNLLAIGNLGARLWLGGYDQPQLIYFPVMVLGFAILSPTPRVSLGSIGAVLIVLFAVAPLADVEHYAFAIGVAIFGSLVASTLLQMAVRREVAARRQLADSEARYRQLAERASDIILQTDVTGSISFVSPNCSILGYEPRELVGRNVLDFVAPDTREQASTQLRDLFAGVPRAEAERRDYHALCKDGTPLLLEGASALVRDEAGLVTGAISHLRDVTAQRAAVTALTQSEAKLRGLFELAPLGIALTDKSGRYLEFNEAFRAICGYEEDELKALDYWRLTPPEFADDEARQLDLLERTGRYGPFVKEYIRKDGSRIPLRLNGMLIEGPDGQTLIWSIIEDITRQLRDQATLVEARDAAEAAAIAKSEFLANMSHEIRTPLTGVIGFAGLLEGMADLPAAARRYAVRIDTSARTLLAVVNDILDFSKLETHKVELDPSPFDPAVLIDETADLLRPQAAAKGLTMTVRLAPDLPPSVTADAARLRQVLLNLLSNAVKFTAEGSIRLVASWQGDMLRVSVADTGVGVPEPLVGRLFQRFSQVDASTTREHGGTGLGLAISKGLVELMGGQIDAHSAPGVGSTFWFTIKAPAAEVENRSAAGPATPVRESPRGPTILVVDDIDLSRELILEMLAPLQASVVAAASGQEAVKAAIGERFDLILMDLQMPGMDGLAATAAIRANAELNAFTPIIALSANVLPEQVRACLAAGMAGHVGKPIEQAALLEVVRKWTVPRTPQRSEPAASDA